MTIQRQGPTVTLPLPSVGLPPDGHAEASCNSDEVITGGGYETIPIPDPIFPNIQAQQVFVTVNFREPGTNTWKVVTTSGIHTGGYTLTAYAECAHLEPVQ